VQTLSKIYGLKYNKYKIASREVIYGITVSKVPNSSICTIASKTIKALLY